MFKVDKSTGASLLLLLGALVYFATPLIWTATGHPMIDSAWGKLATFPALPVFMMVICALAITVIFLAEESRAEWLILIGGLILGIGLCMTFLSTVSGAAIPMIPAGVALAKTGWRDRLPKPGLQSAS